MNYDQLAAAYQQAVRDNNASAMMRLSNAIATREKEEDE